MQFVDIFADGLAAVAQDFPADQVRCLNPVRAFIDRQDTGVAIVLGRAGFLDEPHAAVNLDADRRDFNAGIRAPTLDHRGQQIDALARPFPPAFIRVAMGNVQCRHRIENQCAHRFGMRPHRQQHPPDVGVLDDGGGRAGGGGALALLAFLGEVAGLLEGAFGDGQSLHADGEARVVHHREHAFQAAVFLADQIADRPFAVAIGHDAGRAGADAELMFQGDAAQIVPRAERAVVVD